MSLPSLSTRIVTCGYCGKDVALSIPPEGQEVEPPDFDTRPGETLRSTLPSWVQRCAACGYCSSDVTSIHENAIPLIGTDPYQRIVHDSEFPAKAREFLAYAMILEAVGQEGDAGWSALHAAWSCDDAGDQAHADACRARAIALWKQCKAKGESFGDDTGLEFTIVTDVYRRMGQWEEAVVTCSLALDAEELPPLLEDILRQEKALIDRKDRQAHSLKELPPFREHFSIEVQ